jgi:hypothetical protein
MFPKLSKVYMQVLILQQQGNRKDGPIGKNVHMGQAHTSTSTVQLLLKVQVQVHDYSWYDGTTSARGPGPSYRYVYRIANRTCEK